jgi:type II secretion system protein H
LIEVMVVVVLIAVLSSMVVLATLPNEGAQAEREARRLASLLELSLAEARASGRTIAWSPEGGGYSFWQRSGEGEWTRYPDTSIYRQRVFGGNTEFRRVLVDARELAPGDRVILSPYGSRGLIEATIAGGQAQFILRGGVVGRISLQRIQDQALGVGAPAAGLQRLYPS